MVNKWLTFSKASLSNDEPKSWSDGVAGTACGKGRKHLANATLPLLARSVLSITVPTAITSKPSRSSCRRREKPVCAPYIEHAVAMRSTSQFGRKMSTGVF